MILWTHNDTVYWYYELTLWTDTLYWYCVLLGTFVVLFCYFNLNWYSVLVLCTFGYFCGAFLVVFGYWGTVLVLWCYFWGTPLARTSSPVARFQLAGDPWRVFLEPVNSAWHLHCSMRTLRSKLLLGKHIYFYCCTLFLNGHQRWVRRVSPTASFCKKSCTTLSVAYGCSLFLAFLPADLRFLVLIYLQP